MHWRVIMETLIPHLISVKEAAEMLGIKKKTLDIWRSTQRYFIPYIKIGSSIKYDINDVITFIQKNKVQITSTEYDLI